MTLLELAEMLEKHGGKLASGAQVCRDAAARLESLETCEAFDPDAGRVEHCDAATVWHDVAPTTRRA
jgi:hypothetical protein